MRNTVWKPFDSRFSQLLERMRRHQDLFDQEMRLYDREILTQHFQDFQQYLQESDKVASRDLEKERAEVKQLAGLNSLIGEVLWNTDVCNLDNRLRSLRKWIWNLEHRNTYERAVRRRHPSSCNWVLEKPRYSKWRDHLSNEAKVIASGRNKMEWVTRVLSVQGGFWRSILLV